MRPNLHNVEFIRSAASKTDFIRDGLPKIAFAGRSNVGKSSTINALLNRRSLVRVSEKPGKTAFVNYFLVDRAFYLLDLPGYGYAGVSKERKRAWAALMETFFKEAPELSLCVLVVDARHRPTEDDKTMCGYFRGTGVPYIVAANKTDTVKKSQLEGNLEVIRETLSLPEEVKPIPFSAKKKTGVDILLSKILSEVCLG